MISKFEDFEFRTDDEVFGNILYIICTHSLNVNQKYLLKSMCKIADEIAIENMDYEHKYDLLLNNFLYQRISHESYKKKVLELVNKINSYPDKQSMTFIPDNIELSKYLFMPDSTDEIFLLDDRCDDYVVFIKGNYESKYFCWQDVA